MKKKVILQEVRFEIEAVAERFCDQLISFKLTLENVTFQHQAFHF
jgi:hypothetical protein